MKLTSKNVKWFESEQKQYGTKTAMHNLLFLVASDLLNDLGITRIQASTRKKAA